MKLKIVEKGFEGYSGFIGQTEFVNGVSVRDVSVVESNIISALMRINWVKDEEDVGRAEPRSLGFDSPAPVEPDRSVKEPEQQKPVVKTLKYTREALEEIADKQGLNGIRKIASEYGIKGKSITSLIEMILEAQK